jgi:hypothetical protein
MMKMTDKQPIVEFGINRIVCLDASRERLVVMSGVKVSQRENLHLFAETIDTISGSSRCWVRPLAIARSHPESFKLEFLHDLRDAAQLILPTDLFRDALDTEVLPLISELFDSDRDSSRSIDAQRILYQFIADLYSSSDLDRT